MAGHPWEESYPPGIHWKFEAVNRPVYSILEDSAGQHPDRPCLNFMGKGMSYGDVMAQVTKLACGLQALGVGKGDKIGLCLPNSPYFVVAYFAILKTGATVVNFNPLYTEEELAYQIDDSGVKIMFTLDLKPLYGKVAACVEKTCLEKIVVCSLAAALPPVKSLALRVLKFAQIQRNFDKNFILFFNALIDNSYVLEEVEISPEKDIALLQYTGGTTGVPKGAMLSHANVVSNAAQLKLWMGEPNPAGERFMAVLPFFHVFAMSSTMNLGLLTGSEIILLPRFELKILLKAIHKTRPTFFAAVPTIYNAINNDAGLKKYDLSSIKYCISGGAPLPVATKKSFEELTGCVVVEGYGLSEASPVITCNPVAGMNKAGSIGLPLPGTEVEIRDLENHDKKMPEGERGEVMAKGPQVMAGYWNKPEDSSDVLINGWLRTGDVGHMDKDGYVFLTDRLKEIIICSGYKVYPRVIEEALYKHSAVAEAIVIGIADDYRGEAPKGFVVLKEDASVTAEELLAFTEEHLNPIEKPVAVEIRDTLPKTLIGKLSKKELIEEEQNNTAKGENS